MPQALCVCVCSLHFPVEITALVTKLSNNGLPVLGRELGFQSHLQWCGGAYGHDGGLPYWEPERGYILRPVKKRLFMPVLWMSVCLAAVAVQQLLNTDPLSCGGFDSCLVLFSSFRALH